MRTPPRSATGRFERSGPDRSGYGLELDDIKALRTARLGQGLGRAVGVGSAARRERRLFEGNPVVLHDDAVPLATGSEVRIARDASAPYRALHEQHGPTAECVATATRASAARAGGRA